MRRIRCHVRASAELESEIRLEAISRERWPWCGTSEAHAIASSFTQTSGTAARRPWCLRQEPTALMRGEESCARTVNRHDDWTPSVVAVEDVPTGGRTESGWMEGHGLIQEGARFDSRALGH